MVDTKLQQVRKITCSLSAQLRSCGQVERIWDHHSQPTCMSLLYLRIIWVMTPYLSPLGEIESAAPPACSSLPSFPR